MMNESAVNFVSILLSFFFLFASVVKILGLPKAIFDKQIEFFLIANTGRLSCRVYRAACAVQRY